MRLRAHFNPSDFRGLSVSFNEANTVEAFIRDRLAGSAGSATVSAGLGRVAVLRRRAHDVVVVAHDARPAVTCVRRDEHQPEGVAALHPSGLSGQSIGTSSCAAAGSGTSPSAPSPRHSASAHRHAARANPGARHGAKEERRSAVEGPPAAGGEGSGGRRDPHRLSRSIERPGGHGRSHALGSALHLPSPAASPRASSRAAAPASGDRAPNPEPSANHPAARAVSRRPAAWRPHRRTRNSTPSFRLAITVVK